MILFDVHDRPARSVLDPHRPAEHVRVAVRAWLPFAVIDGLAFVQPRSPRRVLAYARHIGPVATARKILARLSAPDHDRRVSALGAGVVLEAPEASGLASGQHVLFFTPRSLDRPERVVLPPHLITPHDGPLPARFTTVEPLDKNAHSTIQKYTHDLLSILNQHSDPHTNAHPVHINEALRALIAPLLSRDARSEDTPSTVRERVEAAATPRADPTRPDAILFGYGHHARTALMPHLTRRFTLRGVHELDPTLLDEAPQRWAQDTAPLPRQDERAQVFIAAGWHHTHAPIAAHALAHGSWAIIEKPAATAQAQLDLLLNALKAQPSSRLLVAYHKRYAREFGFIREDLRLSGQHTPIRYHATVHVVRLPPRHWYRWPISGSRLISNGCHYIDHFLALNDWCPVASYHALPCPADAAHVQVTLTNGAWMTLTLGEDGSDRLGTREQIEITRGARTVRIADASYQAEDAHRVLRTARLDRMEPYQRMIDAMAATIVADRPGDSAASVRMTHQLVLDLDAAQHEARALGPRGAGVEDPSEASGPRLPDEPIKHEPIKHKEQP
jgi:predicted dehydrogenase